MLDRNMPLAYKDKITIRKNCGPDDICIPDLKLIAQPNVEKYLLGSGKVLEVDVLVQNTGEDSFESMFYMQIPQDIDYLKIEKLNSSAVDIPVQCSYRAHHNNTLKCDIGNPLPAHKQVHFKVMLQPAHHKEGMAPSYNFLMWVNSSNPEENQTKWNNEKEMTINIWVETDLSLTGYVTHIYLLCCVLYTSVWVEGYDPLILGKCVRERLQWFYVAFRGSKANVNISRI